MICRALRFRNQLRAATSSEAANGKGFAKHPYP